MNYTGSYEVEREYQEVYPNYYDYNSNKQKKNMEMKIEGEGKVKANPDIAVISVGIVTENESLRIAQEENRLRANQMIEALKNIGIKAKDIETESYTINRDYDYIDGEQVLRGYIVTNNFRVTVRNIRDTGQVIDVAMDNGGNVINSVEFRVSDTSTYYRRALNLAVEDVLKKSQDMGKFLGVRVSSVPREIIEEDSSPVYFSSQPTLRAPELSTPISPGQIEISARVRAIFEYY